MQIVQKMMNTINFFWKILYFVWHLLLDIKIAIDLSIYPINSGIKFSAWHKCSQKILIEYWLC